MTEYQKMLQEMFKQRLGKKEEKEPSIVGSLYDVTSLVQLEKEFKRLMNIHHPDKPGGNVKVAQEITEAYNKMKGRLK